MKRLLITIFVLFSLVLVSDFSIADDKVKGREGRGRSDGAHRQREGHRGDQYRNRGGRRGDQYRNRGGRRGDQYRNRGGRHGHRHRPNWGFGWGPPMNPYGGYYSPFFYGPRPMPPRPYMRPYGGYYNNGDFGFFFNF